MQRVGIIAEILSDKQCLGKSGEGFSKRWLSKNVGHITHCIVLPRGSVFDNIVGLGFQIDSGKGDIEENEENVFYFNWPQIVEVRTLDGRVLYRNWYLCPKCRRVAKSKDCCFCGCSISVENNRKACTASPFNND